MGLPRLFSCYSQTIETEVLQSLLLHASAKGKTVSEERSSEAGTCVWVQLDDRVLSRRSYLFC